jgi:hypothetical protein
VTLTFTSYNNTTKVGAGTITGTVVSTTPTVKTLNYTFTTTAGGAGGGGTFTAGAVSAVTTTDTADESFVVFDGSDYVAGWLSDTGTTNRTLEFVSLDTSTLAAGTQKSFEPSVNLAPGAGVRAAASASGLILVVGATGTDAGTSAVHGVLYDYTAGTGTDISIGTGTAPRVAYNAASGNFVVAFQSGTDTLVRCYTPAGAAVSAAITAHANAVLAGLAAAGAANNEALVTANDGSGVVGRLVTPGTGAAAGASFELSTSLGGGICAFDGSTGRYLVIVETLILGFFNAQTVRALAAGSTTPVAGTLTLAALTGITGAVGGAQGVIFTTADTNLYAVTGGTTQPVLVGAPIFGAQTGINSDGTSDGPALGTAGGGNYLLLAALGSGGAEAVPLTITP